MKQNDEGDGYRIVSFCETLFADKGVGVRVLLRLPEDDFVLSSELKEEISRFGRNLYDKLLVEWEISDPEHHKRCEEATQRLTALFEQPIFVEQAKNEYSGKVGTPWLIVTTRVGRIKIGWRKRVIQIDWNETRGTQEAADLFRDESVTMERRLIHAWSYDKAAEYLRKILDV